jgi:hypothetical protein
MNLLALALLAGDALGIVARAKRDARVAQADQSIREVTAWLAYTRQHGSPTQITHAEQLLQAWRLYRDYLRKGHR